MVPCIESGVSVKLRLQHLKLGDALQGKGAQSFSTRIIRQQIPAMLDLPHMVGLDRALFGLGARELVLVKRHLTPSRHRVEQVIKQRNVGG